jgi:hypothetical protein
VQNLRRGRYELTAEVLTQDRVRVAFSELAACISRVTPPASHTFGCLKSINATELDG